MRNPLHRRRALSLSSGRPLPPIEFTPGRRVRCCRRPPSAWRMAPTGWLAITPPLRQGNTRTLAVAQLCDSVRGDVGAVHEYQNSPMGIINALEGAWAPTAHLRQRVAGDPDRAAPQVFQDLHQRAISTTDPDHCDRRHRGEAWLIGVQHHRSRLGPGRACWCWGGQRALPMACGSSSR
jgi:hypothetical protein